jgi:hypothetical protein
MATAKYKFNENLIKASHNKDLNNAKKEWHIIYQEKREKQDGLCICQHKVKNITYMYNPITKLTIIVGDICAKKFELNNNSVIPNNILKELLKNSLEKGEYEVIDNIITYSNNIEEQLKKYFENRIETNHNLNELIKIQTEIKELIDTYLLTYLNDNNYQKLAIKISKINVNKQMINLHKQLIRTFLIYSIEIKKKVNNHIYNETIYFRDIDECNDYLSLLNPLGIRYTSIDRNSNEMLNTTLLQLVLRHNDKVIKTLQKNDTNNLQEEPLPYTKKQKPNNTVLNYFTKSCKSI